MGKQEFPSIHFYDQDFMDLYDHSWTKLLGLWKKGTKSNLFESRYFSFPNSESIDQLNACLSSFYLVYSNKTFSSTSLIDNFYRKQEESGAIRGEYSEKDGSPILTKDNPEGIAPPLFAWAEFNLYHREGNKKRLKDVMPILERYYNWIERTFLKENGLYAVPLEAMRMPNSPRDGAVYLVDFNCQMAITTLYLSHIGEILNDKEISFRYKKTYFSLKTRISSLMWNQQDRFYYDLDAKEKPIRIKTIASFWTLLAEIPNKAKAEALIEHLKDANSFGCEHPFPSLATSEKTFDERGLGYRGAVFPAMNYMVIKGLERYMEYSFARASAIRHIYFILEALHPEGKKGDIYEAYLPMKEGPAEWPQSDQFPHSGNIASVTLASISMMIENIIGLNISLPRKTVNWLMLSPEIMGIEDLALRRNMITILSSRSSRGWEIRLESEKLYYFTVQILNEGKKRTLPIPSGKCSMLIDKL